MHAETTATIHDVILLILGGAVGLLSGLIMAIVHYRLAAREAAQERTAELVDQLRNRISAEGRDAEELQKEIDNWVHLQQELRRRPKRYGWGLPAFAGIGLPLWFWTWVIVIALIFLLGCLLTFAVVSLLRGETIQGTMAVGVIILLGCLLVISIMYAWEPFVPEER